jgi:hypothetical protein
MNGRSLGRTAIPAAGVGNFLPKRPYPLSTRVRLGLIGVLLVGFGLSAVAASPATFDDLGLAPESAYTPPDGVSTFRTGDYVFSSYGKSEWNYWEGFAYSSRTDRETHGLDGQYTAIPGVGASGSSAYGVGYVGFAGTSPRLMSASGAPVVFTGLYVTNSATAYHSMAEGDAFAKKFGGPSGTDPDWFRLTAHGLDADGARTGASVSFMLADFRYPDSSLDYIVDDWRWFDLSGLGPVAGVEFTLSSSDVGEWGMNTPAYFAVDEVNGPAPAAPRWYPRTAVPRAQLADGSPAVRYRLTIFAAGREAAPVVTGEFEDADPDDGFVFAEPEFYLGGRVALRPGAYEAVWEYFDPATGTAGEFERTSFEVPAYGAPARIADSAVTVEATGATCAFTPENASGYGYVLQRESADGWRTAAVRSVLYTRAHPALPFPVNRAEAVPLPVSRPGRYRVAVRGVNPLAPWAGDAAEAARAVVEAALPRDAEEALYGPWVGFTITASGAPSTPTALTAAIFQDGADAGAVLQWQGDAEEYRLYVTDEQGIALVDRRITAENRYTLAGPLAAGRYFWTVRGISGGFESDWAAFRAFRVVSSIADSDPTPGMPVDLMAVPSPGQVAFEVSPDPTFPGVGVEFQVVVGGTTDSLSFSGPWAGLRPTRGVSFATRGAEYARPGVDYYVRARAYGETGTVGPWSDYVHYRGVGETPAPAVRIDGLAALADVGVELHLSGAEPGDEVTYQVYDGDAYGVLEGRGTVDGESMLLIPHTATTPVASAATRYYQVRARGTAPGAEWSEWVRYEVEEE